ncbi:MAG: sigma 54-interacting transcriptional regulator [Myxococcota bacterium]
MLGGRYQIERELAAGGQGRVYAGYDSWLDRRVALKQVNSSGAGALRREFAALRAVRHPSLVAALDLVLDEDSATLVEALVEGEALNAWARWQNPRQVLATLAPIAHALAHLHTRGFAHGDISPNNILIDPGGRAVLIDLGFTSRRGAESQTVSGTPGFIAPERLEGSYGIDGPADIWSFGAVLSAVLTGSSDAPADEITPDTVRDLVLDCLRAAPGSRPSAIDLAHRMASLSETALNDWNRPLTELPVVGRDLELHRLDELLHEARSPVWVSGPRGVGKTAVLGEILDRRRAEGRRVIDVSATEASAEDGLVDRLTALSDPEWPEVVALRFRRQSAYERAQTVVLLADRLGKDLVLGIDDAEEPPAFFAELLDLLSRRSVDNGPQVLIAARGELGPRDGVELAPFELAGVEELVRTAFAEARPKTAAAVFDLAGGLPAGAVELLRIAAEHGVEIETIQPADLQQLADASVPDTLVPVFLAEGTLSPEVLRTLLADDPQSAALAEREGWLQWIPDAGVFRVPRSVREGWEVEDPRVHYRALAEAYAEHGEHVGAATAFAGAGETERWLFHLSELTDDYDWLMTARRIGGGIGLESFSDDALTRLGWLAAESGDAASAYTAAEALGLRGRARDGRMIRGAAAVKVGRYPEALEALDGVAEGSREVVLLARALYFAARAGEARQTIIRGSAELEGEDRARGFDIAGHASFALGEPADGISWLERALDAAVERGVSSEVSRAKHSLAIALHRAGDLDRAHRLYAESIAADDPLAATTRKLNYATLLHDRGKYVDAESLYRDASARAAQLANVREYARAGVNLANLLLLIGELAEAQERAEDTARYCATHGLLQAEVMAELVMLEASIEAERPDQARKWLAAVREGLTRVEDSVASAEASLLEARLLALEGAPGLAVEQLESLEIPDVSNLRARYALELASAAVLLRDGPASARLAWTERAAELASALGDEGRWRALALHARALELAEDDSAEQTRAEARGILERLLAEMNDRGRVSYVSTERRRRLKLSLAARSEQSAPVSVFSSAADGADRRYRRLLFLNRQLAREGDVDVLLERIVDAAIELLGAERGFILLDSGEGVRIAVARNLDRRALEGNARFSRTIATEVFNLGDPVLTNNAQVDTRFAEAVSVASTQIRSVLCVPLRGIARGEDPLIGALYLDHRFQDRAFTEADVELCSSFADQVTIALESARLVAHVRAQEAELERQNQALAELNKSLQQDAARSSEAAEAAMRRLREEGPTLGVGRGLEGIVGRSNGLRQAIRFVDRFCDTDVPVLVLGESGTGKELIARALHQRSDRHDAPFVSVNCGAIPETLFESELFGHVKGAFTGAHRDKPGLFAAAENGTLFLDEIAEMPLQMQVKLLRVLQESEFRPVGGAALQKSEARIVAATHRNLEQRVAEGSFREDLYYRLNVVQIRVPPLRERRDDILLLVEHFTRHLTGEGAESLFSVESLQQLVAYDWPGNVRELENEIQRALALAEDRVRPEDLSEKLQAVRPSRAAHAAAQARGSLKEIMETYEKEVLLLALERTQWNVRQTAKELGLSRAALYTRMGKFGITRDRYAGDPSETH